MPGYGIRVIGMAKKCTYIYTNKYLAKFRRMQVLTAIMKLSYARIGNE
jgi:hypothetical protein